jgi:hypothetical protein
MLATLINTETLGKVILYSFVVSVGVTTVFSFGIVGLTRFDERRRAGSGGVAYAVLAAFCAVIVAVIVVEAIAVLVKK